MTAEDPASGPQQAPGLWRRLACFVYEGVLLFGVLMAAGLLYSLATGRHGTLDGRLGLQIFLFIVLGAYFIGFWSRTGQTLAMQTWHIRLTTQEGLPLSPVRAFARYLCAYLWFVPALVSLWAAGLAHSRSAVALALVVGVLGYAALTWLNPRRQYLHDLICRTQLVRWRAETAAPKARI